MKSYQQELGSHFAAIHIPEYYEPYMDILENSYRKNELIVIFPHPPSKREINKVKESLIEKDIKGIKRKEDIKIVKCDNCNLPIQLWLAEGIETAVVAKGVKAGSAPPPTGTVGESYSLNFLSKIPAHPWTYVKSNNVTPPKYPPSAGEAIRIAVLDTGVDPFLVDRKYLYKNPPKGPGLECFHYSEYGWNFVADNDDVEDDSADRHGSLVTQFIINQFNNASNNAVEIIPLKTHDRKGKGDLFKIFCAIYYAIEKGAKIINASWGFYYYLETPLSPLNYLMNVLRDKGILFITAAGNQTDADDKFATAILEARGIDPTPFELRDLAIHQFLPACLSKGAENVITVTTTDGKAVAVTENHSNIYVDMGVIADKRKVGDLWFKVPFAQVGNAGYVRGSSFATAIATGIVGANCDKALYIHGAIDKKTFIGQLIGLSPDFPAGGLCGKFGRLAKHLIKDGVCLR